MRDFIKSQPTSLLFSDKLVTIFPRIIRLKMKRYKYDNHVGYWDSSKKRQTRNYISFLKPRWLKHHTLSGKSDPQG